MQIPNTFHIQAQAEKWQEYASVEELLGLLRDLKPGEPWHHVGAGSNLVPLGDYRGTMFHSRVLGIEPLGDAGDGTALVRVGAGETWDRVVAALLREGLYGAENLSLIPGEAGAAAVQNIGAYGVEISELVESVETLHVPTLAQRTFRKDECQYAYRRSRFKHGDEAGQYIVLHVVLRLSRTFVPKLRYGGLLREVQAAGFTPETLTAGDLRDIIIRTRRKKLPDPDVMGSAGSFFMNPVVPTEKALALSQEHPEMPVYPAGDGFAKLSAGWLIEKCGWKGRALGHAAVYEHQALILVNRDGEATGRDVLRLAQTIQNNVQQRFGIQLVPEAQFLS